MEVGAFLTMGRSLDLSPISKFGIFGDLYSNPPLDFRFGGDFPAPLFCDADDVDWGAAFWATVAILSPTLTFDEEGRVVVFDEGFCGADWWEDDADLPLIFPVNDGWAFSFPFDD